MKNFASMMKQAQELQGRMAEMQAEMERARIEGQSGGGLVVLTMNGKGDLAGVKIDPSLLKSEEAEILEDLSHQYLVSYAYPGDKRDGKRHEIRVETKNKSHNVRARDSYTAVPR